LHGGTERNRRRTRKADAIGGGTRPAAYGEQRTRIVIVEREVVICVRPGQIELVGRVVCLVVVLQPVRVGDRTGHREFEAVDRRCAKNECLAIGYERPRRTHHDRIVVRVVLPTKIRHAQRTVGPEGAREVGNRRAFGRRIGRAE
jgi:hypothetical protein